MNVLNLLSPAVAADSENIPGGTALVQRRRKRVDEGKEESQRRNKFRSDVTNSLAEIALSNRLLAMDMAIANKEEGIRLEEGRVHEFRLASFKARDEPELKDYYQSLISHHSSRVTDYTDELNTMKNERWALLNPELTDVNATAAGEQRMETPP